MFFYYFFNNLLSPFIISDSSWTLRTKAESMKSVLTLTTANFSGFTKSSFMDSNSNGHIFYIINGLFH